MRVYFALSFEDYSFEDLVAMPFVAKTGRPSMYARVSPAIKYPPATQGRTLVSIQRFDLR